MLIEPLFSALLAATSTSSLQIEAGLFAASPAALGTGQQIGPSLGGAWRIDDWSIALRANLGFATADDPTWRIQHTEVRVGLGGAYVLELGRGEVSLGVVIGAVGVDELRTRHQAERLGSAGIDAETRGFSLGGFGAIDAGVRVVLIDALAVAVHAGPCWTLISTAEGQKIGRGFIGGLGLALTLN